MQTQAYVCAEQRTAIIAHRPVVYRSYPDALPLVVLRLLGTSTAVLPEPPDDVPDGLRRRYDVERDRNRSALLEIAHPQAGASELPLRVGVVLFAEEDILFVFRLPSNHYT